jgi:PAS domain S-box-containing protein
LKSKANILQPKYQSKSYLIGIFLITILLMTCYETLKEIYFKGQLTPWQSHGITILVTSFYATIAGVFMRNIVGKYAKEAHHASAKAQSVITNIFDAVIMIDELGIIKNFNPAAEKIFGHSAETILGESVNVLMPESYANQHDNYIALYKETGIQKIVGKSRREFPAKKINGDVFPIDLIVTKMDVEGKKMFIGVVRDITEFKCAELELMRIKKEQLDIYEKLQQELCMASSLQMMMLPKCYYLFPCQPQVRAYGIMRPAKEVGGDFYDAFMIDDEHLIFAIGDVSGKGVPASLFMMRTIALLKSKITKPKKFDTALIAMNKLLCEHNDTNMFVSLFIGMLNVKTGELRYLSGGHNAPFFIRHNSSVTLLEVPRNLVLGISDSAHYQVTNIQLQKGDTLVLYTDGVIEAENTHNELFTLQRTMDILKSAHSDVKQLVSSLSDELNKFCHGQQQSDDITILALRYNPDATVQLKNSLFEWSD